MQWIALFIAKVLFGLVVLAFTLMTLSGYLVNGASYHFFAQLIASFVAIYLYVFICLKTPLGLAPKSRR